LDTFPHSPKAGDFGGNVSASHRAVSLERLEKSARVSKIDSSF
jgi:hypothetical protein